MTSNKWQIIYPSIYTSVPVGFPAIFLVTNQKSHGQVEDLTVEKNMNLERVTKK